MIYTDSGTQQIVETKRLWTLGNFSRFVRPGAVRIDAEASGGALRVSAFEGDEQGRIVLVIVNSGIAAVDATLRFEDGTAPRTMKLFETSETYNLASKGGQLPVGALALAGRSITTLVLQ